MKKKEREVEAQKKWKEKNIAPALSHLKRCDSCKIHERLEGKSGRRNKLMPKVRCGRTRKAVVEVVAKWAGNLEYWKENKMHTVVMSFETTLHKSDQRI